MNTVNTFIDVGQPGALSTNWQRVSATLELEGSGVRVKFKIDYKEVEIAIDGDALAKLHPHFFQKNATPGDLWIIDSYGNCVGIIKPPVPQADLTHSDSGDN